MKKIYLLLTILTTAVIGLVFASPTYAYYYVPDTTDELRNVVSFDDLNNAIPSIITGYDLYEIYFEWSGSLGPNVFYQGNFNYIPPGFDINFWFLGGSYNPLVYIDSMSTKYDMVLKIPPLYIKQFEYGDDEIIANEVFQLEFKESWMTVYALVSDDVTNMQVYTAVNDFISQFYYYKQGFFNDYIDTITNYYNFTSVYDQAKQEGYNDGYRDGKEHYGYWDESLEIYVDADYAYDEGYDDGLNADFDYFAWMRTALWLPAQILAIEIWPGFQLGYFVMFTLFISFVGFFFRLFGKK